MCSISALAFEQKERLVATFFYYKTTCFSNVDHVHLPACRRLLFPLLQAEKGLLFRVQQRK